VYQLVRPGLGNIVMNKTRLSKSIVILAVVQALIVGLLFLFLSGCSFIKKKPADAAIAADGITTSIGIASGIAQEANPVLSGLDSGAGVGSIALSYVANNQFKKSPYCPKYLRNFTAFKSGLALNNIAIIAGTSSVVSAFLGISGGMFLKRYLKDSYFSKECGYVTEVMQPDTEFIPHITEVI